MFILIADTKRYSTIAERTPKFLTCGPKTTSEQATKLRDHLSYIEASCNDLYVLYELVEIGEIPTLIQVD